MSNVSNVVKSLRITEGLTQEQLAEQAGVSTLFIIRAEQFLHPNLSDKVAEALINLNANADFWNVDALKIQYANQREQFLAEFKHRLTGAMNYRSVVNEAISYAADHYVPVAETLPVNERSSRHPFTLFRTYLFDHYGLPTSQIKFCINTGLHPAVLSSLESRKTNMEEPVADVLRNQLSLNDEQVLILRRLCDDCF